MSGIGHMKVPAEFTVSYNGDRYHVGWHDEVASYHVWLNEKRVPMTPWSNEPATIYVNRHDTRKRRDHKTSRRVLANHPGIARAISAIPAERFEVALQKAQQREAQRAADATKQAIADLRQEAARYGYMLIKKDEL